MDFRCMGLATVISDPYSFAIPFGDGTHSTDGSQHRQLVTKQAVQTFRRRHKINCKQFMRVRVQIPMYLRISERIRCVPACRPAHP